MKKLLTLFCMASVSCLAQFRTSSTAIIIDSVTVNLGQPVAAKSLSGFLGGLKNPVYPNRDDIRKLQPKLMRISSQNHYAEAYSLAGRVHFISSDPWKQRIDSKGSPNFNVTHPYLDQTFKDHLEALFKWGYNKGNVLPGIVWECWNEPDGHLYPNWTMQDFYETYKLTYTTLRKSALGSKALIAGPSLAEFDEAKMKDFFDYCLANELEVNVVTWHEITYLDQQKPLGILQQHVKYVRDNFIDNPKYAPLKIQTIEINEIVGPEDKNRPSEIAGYLRNLEDAGVDYASKSCNYHITNRDAVGNVVSYVPCDWGSCEDTSFNDLFTIDFDSENYINFSDKCNPLPHNAHKTKSAWWVYKLYADGVPYRVKSHNREPRSHVIASSKIQPYPDETPTNTAQILIGYSNEWPQNDLPDTGNYEVRIESLSALSVDTDVYAVKICKIPFNGADSYNKSEDNDELANPILISTGYYMADANDSITITFSAQTDDLYQITISAVN